jgi:hypothetical protein
MCFGCPGQIGNVATWQKYIAFLDNATSLKALMTILPCFWGKQIYRKPENHPDRLAKNEE